MEIRDSEVLKTIGQMALDASDIKVFDIPNEPKGTYGIYVKKTGAFEVKKGKGQARQYTARLLPDFCATVLDLQEEYPKPKVFVTEGGIVAVLDETERREVTVRMTLSKTRAFITLSECENRRAYLPHSDFMRMLRVELDLGADPAYAALKVLKFNEDSAANSDVTSANASMGRSVMRAVVAGGGVIPDTVQVTFPLYEELDQSAIERREIQCLIDVNLEAQTISLIPRQLELFNAKRITAEAIKVALVESLGMDIPVYIGAPN